MRISDWSSDVCSSDLREGALQSGIEVAGAVATVPVGLFLPGGAGPPASLFTVAVSGLILVLGLGHGCLLRTDNDSETPQQPGSSPKAALLPKIFSINIGI